LIVIDYALTNKKTWYLIESSRMYWGSDIRSDHFLLTSNVEIPARWKKSSKNGEASNETFEAKLLRDGSLKRMYIIQGAITAYKQIRLPET